MSADRPVDMKQNNLNSWSHLNSDQPVVHHHGLKISRFLQCLEQFECGHCIQDKFTVVVGGKETSWELRVYPNGYEEETSAYLAVFVKHKEGNNKYLLKSTISILDSSGKDKKVPCELPGKILSCKQMHGTKKYIQREQLLHNTQLYQHDSLTFILDVEICLPDSKTTTVFPINPDSETLRETEDKKVREEITTKLQADYESLFESSVHSDVVLKCGNRTFSCHKAILSSRSPVFDAMFRHSMQENLHSEVEIEDLEADTVQLMLKNIYSGHLEPNSSTKELLSAADKYQLTQLKTACELSLSRSIHVSNCIELLILADVHTADTLKTAALSFIVTNLQKIISNPNWQDELSPHPNITAQILKVRTGSLDSVRMIDLMFAGDGSAELQPRDQWSAQRQEEEERTDQLQGDIRPVSLCQFRQRDRVMKIFHFSRLTLRLVFLFIKSNSKFSKNFL